MSASALASSAAGMAAAAAFTSSAPAAAAVSTGTGAAIASTTHNTFGNTSLEREGGGVAGLGGETPVAYVSPGEDGGRGLGVTGAGVLGGGAIAGSGVAHASPPAPSVYVCGVFVSLCAWCVCLPLSVSVITWVTLPQSV